MAPLKIEVDTEADAAYVVVESMPIASTRKLDANRLLDTNHSGDVIGIEFLNISRGVDLTGLPFRDQLIRLFRDHNIRQYA